MKLPVIANLGLGSGIPKTIVPLTGKTADDVLEQARAAMDAGADCVEWRIDHFSLVEAQEEVLAALTRLRTTLNNTPLLCTVRSAAQGGETQLDATFITELQRALITSGEVDFIDIELSGGTPESTQEIVAFAGECGVAVVISDHNFAATPTFDVLYATLEEEYKLGADICKLAVMAKQEGDELQLMAATHQFMQDHPDTLAIGISMSEIGTITRLAGEFFGSCMTFCTAGAASAPGQVDIATARRIMTQLHEEGFDGGTLQ